MDNKNESPEKEESRLRRQLLLLAEVLYRQQSRLFLRHNLLVPELERMLRWSSIHTAMSDPEFAIAVAGQLKQKASHAAVRTGLTMTEVRRATENRATPPVNPDGGHLHRLIRIVTAWRTDPDYQDDDGKPIDLHVRGGTPSLDTLCRRYARGVPTRPIADALVQNGNAEWIGPSEGNRTGKKLRFLNGVITADCHPSENVEIFTQIGSDFMYSFQQMFNPSARSRPRFREGYYNDIDEEKSNDALAELHTEMQAFNRRCTDILQKYRAVPGKSVVRVGVGSYSFQNAPLVLKEPDGEEKTDLTHLNP